jgi:hypothetical protein
MSECKVCGQEHNGDLHRAVLAVRAWLRERMLRACEPPRKPGKTQPPHPNQFYLQGSGRP